jgi:glutathione S-transferase
LQWVAEQFPAAGLAPPDALGRARLRQWLCFVGTEIHKGLFMPLLDANAPEDAKRYALTKGEARLRFVADALDGREYLLDRLSVADAYLFTVLNWAVVTPVDLERFPSIKAYQRRLRQRPSFARAYTEERTLYAKELARHAAQGAWGAVTSAASTIFGS